jgi:hypothetical protein
VDAETLEKIKKEVIEAYEAKCGNGVLNPNHFEIVVIIAQKP